MSQLTYSPPASSLDDRRFAEDLHSLLGVIWRGWRYVAVSVLVCLTIAVFFAARVKTVYKGTARLLILQQGGRPLSITGSDPFRPGDTDDYLPTHIMIIRSPLIVERAIESSGLKDLTVAGVIARLTVLRPEPAAKILEIGYQAESRHDSMAMVSAIMKSYKKFLEDNYQKNTSDVIKLIQNAKDDLAHDHDRLEREYIAFREKHPVFAVTEDGRSPLVRKLDKWEEAENEATLREVHLKAQLQLGHKLRKEGLGMWSVANALRLLGGGTDIGTPPETPGLGGDGSLEQVSTQLADVELRRQTAERLLDHLRAEHENSANVRAVSIDEVAEAFYAEPAAAELRAQIMQLREKLRTGRRLSRNSGDPAIIATQGRVQRLEDQLGRLWRKRRPALEKLIAQGGPNEEVAALVRKAEADLVALRAEESVLRERIEPLRAQQPARALAGRDGAPVAGEKAPDDAVAGASPAGRMQTDILLGSIERSLDAIKSLRIEMRRKYETDLNESKDTELDRLKDAKLRSALERNKRMFDSVLDQLKQAQLVSDYSSITAQVLNPPTAAPGRPLAVFILIAALVFGCGLGIGCAFLADMLDARIRTLPEIRKALDLSVLGLIPQLPKESDEYPTEMGLISHIMPRSMIGESYKSIRTNLEFHRRSRRVQVLQMTSPHSGDGKSTTASNLAISLAHAGRKVLLVDGDLRRPSQHHIFSLCRDRGLIHILKDLLPVHMVVQATSIENLDFISSGPEVHNPAELLASHRFGDFLETVRESYDIIIVDSPPLLAVTDPCVIGAAVDGIVLVVRATAIKRHEAEQTVELLRTLGTPVLGTVINGITKEQSRYGYGYGYGYGVGYGFGTYGNANAARSLDEPVVTQDVGHSNGTSLPPLDG